MDRGGDDMTEDEAREILNSTTGEHPIVVRYPWWVTLRLPLLIMAAAFLVQGAALLALTILQVNDTTASKEQRELLACRNAYTAKITEAAAQTRAATAKAQSLFNEGLVVIISGGEVSDLDIEGLLTANAKLDESVSNDAAAIQARDEWESAGASLPCPITLIAPPD